MPLTTSSLYTVTVANSFVVVAGKVCRFKRVPLEVVLQPRAYTKHVDAPLAATVRYAMGEWKSTEIVVLTLMTR